MGISAFAIQSCAVNFSSCLAPRAHSYSKTLRPKLLTTDSVYRLANLPISVGVQTLLCSSARAASGGDQPGGNVIDRPTTLPGLGDKRETKKKKPPKYRVMLHNDSVNRREYVVKVLLKVVDGYTVDDAVNVMQKAHIDGLACVISCSQEDAETYCEGLRGNGLISSVEPDN